MTADELLVETAKRIREDDVRTPQQAMYTFVAEEVAIYDGLTVTPDHAYVEQWLKGIVTGLPDEDAAEMDTDIVESLGRFLA